MGRVNANLVTVGKIRTASAYVHLIHVCNFPYMRYGRDVAQRASSTYCGSISFSDKEGREVETNCAEKTRLLTNYETTACEFSRTVSVMKAGIRVHFVEDHEEMEAAAEQMRMRCQQARHLLDAHIAEHGS